MISILVNNAAKHLNPVIVLLSQLQRETITLNYESGQNQVMINHPYFIYFLIFEIRFCYAALTGLELTTIFLPLFSECWDQRKACTICRPIEELLLFL